MSAEKVAARALAEAITLVVLAMITLVGYRFNFYGLSELTK